MSLVGDFLLSKGLLLSIDNSDFDLLKIISTAVREMSEGELLQIEKTRKLDITENIYFGSKPLEGFKKIDHLVQMLSLDNAFDNNELKEFDSRVLERLSLESSIEYSCEPKLDGVAANLLYKNGILDCASTRGDGKTGEDITHNIRTIKSIPLELSTLTNYQIPDLVEIRGEVFIELSDFEEINSRSKKEC